MDFNIMTVEEIIAYFCNKFDSDEPFTLSELRKAAKVCSITDPISNADAVTIFYSGGEDEIANSLAASNNENIRVIRRTDRFELLSYKDELNKGHSFDEWVMKAIKDENPSIDKDTINNKFIQEMYGVSDAGTDITEIGDGFWSQASSDFAAETKGSSYALIGNAREDRIFSRDELKQLYNAIGLCQVKGGNFIFYFISIILQYIFSLHPFKFIAYL